MEVAHGATMNTWWNNDKNRNTTWNSEKMHGTARWAGNLVNKAQQGETQVRK